MNQKTMEMQVDAMMRVSGTQSEKDREQIRRKLMKRHPPQNEVLTEAGIILKELGIPGAVENYSHAVQAIAMVVQDESLADHITTVVYPRLAERFGVTQDRLRRSIWALIAVSCIKGDMDKLKYYFEDLIYRDSERPFDAEYILRLAREVRRRLKL